MAPFAPQPAEDVAVAEIELVTDAPTQYVAGLPDTATDAAVYLNAKALPDSNTQISAVNTALKKRVKFSMIYNVKAMKRSFYDLMTLSKQLFF